MVVVPTALSVIKQKLRFNLPLSLPIFSVFPHDTDSGKDVWARVPLFLVHTFLSDCNGHNTLSRITYFTSPSPLSNALFLKVTVMKASTLANSPLF